MNKLYTLKNTIHQSTGISVALEKVGSNFLLSVNPIRPATVTIYNVSTAGAGWTAVALGLTGVLSWKLTEKNGRAFHYCFDGVGATYMTSYGSLQRDTEITDIYVMRTTATDIDAQLEIWTA